MSENLPALRGVDVVDTETGEVLVGHVVEEGFDPEDWDDNVNLAQQTNEKIKEGRLLLGAIVENVVQRWGQHGNIGQVMDEFAKKSGIAKSTLYEYRRVHKAFPEGGPAELDYSHLRQSIKAGTKEGEHVEAAAEAAEQGLTTRSMARRQSDREQNGKAEKVQETKVCSACGGTGEVPA